MKEWGKTKENNSGDGEDDTNQIASFSVTRKKENDFILYIMVYSTPNSNQLSQALPSHILN